MSSWKAAAEYINDPLAVIYTEGQWSLCKVSPLNNLKYDRVRFKQYASKIRQALVCLVSAKSSLQYVVQFDSLPLKYSEEDFDAIEISVSTTNDNTKERQKPNAKTKVAYTGILLAWGASNSLDEAVHLPYLLERGQRKLGDTVKTCLQKIFDCNIKSFSFTQYQLLMFGFNFVESVPFRSTDAFVLSYTTPQPDLKDRVEFKFEAGVVHTMCYENACFETLKTPCKQGFDKSKDKAENMSELVSRVYQMLQRQIMAEICFDMSVLDIIKITMPKAEVKSSGSVKMKTPEVVNAVLKVLNEIVFNESLLEGSSSSSFGAADLTES